MTPAEIKALRASLGWSQSRLATELGITRRYVTELESGRKEPSRALTLALLYVKGQVLG